MLSRMAILGAFLTQAATLSLAFADNGLVGNWRAVARSAD